MPREEQALEDFQSFINQVCLTEGRLDKWVWTVSDDGSYSVKSAFSVLQESELEEPNQAFSLMWKTTAPSNVLAFG